MNFFHLKHDGLAKKLATSLLNDNRMVWEDMPMGSAGSCRPDVFTLQKSFSNPQPTSYEIKVSKSDFLSDVKSGKWRKYLSFSDSVIFVVPKGMLKKSDIPEGAGLMTFNEDFKMFRTVKRPTLKGESNLSNEILLKLLMEGGRRESKRSIPQPRDANDWEALNGLRRDKGHLIAKGIERLKTFDKEVERFEKGKSSFCRAIGLEGLSPHDYAISSRCLQMTELYENEKEAGIKDVEELVQSLVSNLQRQLARLKK